ncbi:MAG: M20/M25/M40 family metallo-hydrolase [Phycisphaerae bacterium]
MPGILNPYRRGLTHAVLTILAGVAGCATGRGVDRFDVPVERYRAHIALLASDELKGRGTGSEGVDLAGGYIAGQFAAAGLNPGAANGTYFQSFSVPRKGKLLDDTALSEEGMDAPLALHEGFAPFGFSASGPIAGDVAFVGYGITNPEESFDDYAGIDVEGKIVLMLRREPPAWDESGRNTRHAFFSTKIKLAKAHGAAAVLIVNQVPESGDADSDDADELIRFRPRGGDHELPAVHLKRRVADEWLSRAGLVSLIELQAQLDTDGRNVSAPLPGIRLRGRVSYEQEDMAIRNIIGILPGMGHHAEEYVVVGAHYDHLGVRGGKIHNGADDNASGTAGMMETAFALAAQAYRDRSVMFIAFGGEELGLLGSKHFVEDAPISLSAIVAMINLDMIGRMDPASEANMLGIQGIGTAAGFVSLVGTRAKQAGVPFLPEPSARGPSDHASFYRAGIPALFFFTGLHEDYHAPGDDTEKIHFQDAVQVTKLVCRVVFDLVNAESRPVFQEVAQRARIMRGDRPGRLHVVLGIVPDREDASALPGWPIGAVVPGGAAGKAGMKAGDRITAVDGKPVSGQADYRKAVADKHPGDVVSIVFLRKDREMSVDVTLQGP